MGTGRILPSGRSCRGLKLFPHLHMQPRLRMHGIIPPLSLRLYELQGKLPFCLCSWASFILILTLYFPVVRLCTARWNTKLIFPHTVYVVGSKIFRPDQLFKVTEIKQLFYISTQSPFISGAWGSVVVKALRYQSDGPGIDSLWCHWTSDQTMALVSTQPVVKMSTRNIPGGKGGRCVRLTTYHHTVPLS